MKRYKISIDGCDDSTVFEMELTEQEAELVKRICNRSSETSTYGCMPTMEIEEAVGTDA